MMYRRRALRQLEAPEELDQAIRLATVPGWLVTAVLVLVVGGAVTWSSLVTVPQTVDAHGMISHPGGVSTLQATDGGMVTDVWIDGASHVTPGDPLVAVTDDDGTVHEITAPWDAYVGAVLVRDGELLQPGMPVAELIRLDTPEDGLTARVYLDSRYAPLIQAGMPVDVEVHAAPAAVFGTVHGTVVEVGRQQETPDTVRAFFGESADPGEMLGDGTAVAVTVALEQAPGTDTGLLWSKNEPPFTLSALTASTARFTVAEERPVEWLVRG